MKKNTLHIEGSRVYLLHIIDKIKHIVMIYE